MPRRAKWSNIPPLGRWKKRQELWDENRFGFSEFLVDEREVEWWHGHMSRIPTWTVSKLWPVGRNDMENEEEVQAYEEGELHYSQMSIVAAFWHTVIRQMMKGGIRRERGVEEKCSTRVDSGEGPPYYHRGFWHWNHNAFILDKHVLIVNNSISGTLWLLKILSEMEKTGERGCPVLH